MKAVMQTLLILMLASLGLTGCGQKGDLFLPATPPPVSAPVEPAPIQPEQKMPEQQQPAKNGTASPESTQQAQSSTSNTKR